jgi:hypothetical protein
MQTADHLVGLDYIFVGGNLWGKCHSNRFTLLSSPFQPDTLCVCCMEYFTSDHSIMCILSFKWSTLWPTFFLCMMRELRTVIWSGLLNNFMYHLFILSLSLGTSAVADPSYWFQPCIGYNESHT